MSLIGGLSLKEKLWVFYLFSTTFLCESKILTAKENGNNVLCVSHGTDLGYETPAILQPPSYAKKFDNYEYFNFTPNFENWVTLDSRNLPLAPVLDKRWENFFVETGYFIEFKSIHHITPFSVCANGNMEINIFDKNGDEFRQTILTPSRDKVEGSQCKWMHYFIEIADKNIILYQNYEKIFSKVIKADFRKIKIETSSSSFWKIHFYEFQQVMITENNFFENFDLEATTDTENVCVSLYVALTRGLSLTIKLTSGEFSDEKTIYFNSRSSPDLIVWQNVRLNITSNRIANLSIKATSEKFSSNQFWLIDLKHIKSCSKIFEFQRFILHGTDIENYSCETLTYDYEKLKCAFEESFIIKNDLNNLSLNWKLQEGIFSIMKYIITYQMIGKPLCNDIDNTSNAEINSLTIYGNETNAQLENLEYFANYAINITIVTDQGNVTIFRDATTTVSPDIGNTAINLKFTENNLVTISFEDCIQLNGPLNITLALKCLDEWCLNEIQYDNINIDSDNILKTIKFSKFKLQAFTNYQPKIEIRRFHKTFNKILPLAKTHPGDPAPVENVSVESTSTELFLKWKAPYPPTGIVSYYTIICEDDEIFYARFNISSQNYCSDSREFLCFNINNLNHTTTYYIHIFVKNENVEEIDSSKKFLMIDTDQKVPEAPFNLTLEWNNYSKKFHLTWDYPITLLTSIEAFFVKISDERGNQQNYIEIQNNTSEFELDNFRSYNISVTAKSKYFSEEATINVRSFPPFEDFPVMEECSNSHCVLKVFDSKKGKLRVLLLKNDKMANKDIAEILKKCFYNLNSTNEWNLLHEKILAEDTYRRVNIDGGVGIIFTLNRNTSYISMNNLDLKESRHSVSSISSSRPALMIILFILILIVIIFVIIYMTIIWTRSNDLQFCKNKMEDNISEARTKENENLLEAF